MMTVGERLRAERKRATCMNQGDFGEACGVHLNTQSRFEQDKHSPDADYLAKAYSLGVDINYVVTGEQR